MMDITAIFYPKIGLIFFQTVVMICVAFVLKKYAWKSVLSFIQKEEEAYAAAVGEKERAQKKVAKLRQLSDTIITKAKEKSGRIIDNAMASKEAFLEEAKMEAAITKAEVIEKAKQIIAKAEATSRLQLKRDVADLVVQTLKKVLTIELSHTTMQEKLLHQFIEEASKEQHNAANRYAA